MLFYVNNRRKEIATYAFCGAIATIVDLSLLTGLRLTTDYHYLLITGLAFSLAIIVKFSLISIFILRYYQRRRLVFEIVLFLLIALVGLIINQAIIKVFGANYLFIGKAFAIIIVIAWNYFMQKIMLFNKPKI